MSITPLSDIVLDVARAVDPVRSAAATARLVRLAQAEAGSGPSFEQFAETTRPTPAEPSIAATPVTSRSARTQPRIDTRADAVKGLEQLVLQELVDSMLPEQGGTIFGGGSAGDVWRSMLSRQLAAQIGSVVDLGMGQAMPWLTRTDPAPEHTERPSGRETK